MPSRRFTDVQSVEIRRAYETGASSVELASKYLCSHATILHEVRRAGGTIRTNSECQRKYPCNHAAFDEITTEPQAYWLGFIAADGCITGGALTINLAAKDRDHLYSFRSFLASEHPVSERLNDGFPRASFYVSSARLIADLQRHGIAPRKSLTHEWPVALPSDLLPHYVRGYVDGDGSWGVGYRKKNPHHSPGLSVDILGSESFCDSLADYLCEEANVSRGYICRPHNSAISQVRYGGTQQVSRIFQLLYDGASIWLPRKREKIEPHVSLERRRSPRTSLRCVTAAQLVEMKELYATGQYPHIALARQFNISAATVSRVLAGKTPTS